MTNERRRKGERMCKLWRAEEVANESVGGVWQRKRDTYLGIISFINVLKDML